MCAEFQEVSDPEKPSWDGRHKLFLYPRGTFKTTVLTISGAIFEIINNPDIRILISNANLENAKTILKGIKDHFTMNEKFRSTFPEVCPHWKKGSMKEFGTQTEFTVPNRKPGIKEATVEAGSVEGNLVSRHYDMHIGDDLVNDKNTTTREQIEKVDFFRKAVYSLLEPTVSRDYLIGTIWHWDDVYSRIIEDKESQYKVYKRAIWEKNEEGKLESIFPYRFPNKEIRNIRRKQGDQMFSAQYLNQALDDEAATFKRDWILYYEVPPEGLYIITCIDPAVSQAIRSDFSAIVTIGVGPDDETYVLEAKRGKWNPLELINEIFNVYIRWKPSRIGIESFGFQSSIRFFLTEEMRRRNMYIPIQELSHESNRSKEARVMGLQPRVQYCKFYVRNDMTELIDEMLRFPKAKHDDLIDALAYTEQLRRTPGKKATPSQLAGYTFNETLQKIRDQRMATGRIGAHRLTLEKLRDG